MRHYYRQQSINVKFFFAKICPFLPKLVYTRFSSLTQILGKNCVIFLRIKSPLPVCENYESCYFMTVSCENGRQGQKYILE